MPNSLERITGPHIYIDGPDLSGKDTIAEHLQKQFNFAKMHRLFMRPENPHEVALRKLRPDESEFIGSILARSILYEIKNFELHQPTLLVSSHALRGAAVQAGLREPLAPLFEDLSAYHPHLDVTVLLKVDVETRQKRLDGRPHQASSFDRKIYTDPDFIRLMDSTFLRLAVDHFGATVVETSKLTIDESRLAVMQAINIALAPTTIKTVQPKPLHRNLKYFEDELTRYENFVRRRFKVGV